MKKILWLCNVKFIEEKIKTTASWLQPLAELLQASGQVSIFNVTIGNVNEIQHVNYKGIEQWIIPNFRTSGYGQIPSRKFCKALSEIENKINPDLVHIWGTENVWASAYAQGAIKAKTFIDIQGILSSSYYYYYGGMTFKNILQSIYLKEILMPWRTLFHKKEVFKQRGKIEIECLKKFKYISYQSEWVKNHLSFINPTATYLPTKILLRDSFYTASPWTYKDYGNSPIIFSTASGAIPYKGIHILLRSIRLLKDIYPNIQLRVAGNMKIGNRLLDGYSIYLKKLIKKLGIENNVILLGPIDETQIVRELQNVNVCVIPSFVETYCLAFAESMMIGVPTIASFTGAMPELGQHGKECLFYNPIDFQTCAHYMDLLIKNKELAEYLSQNGRAKRLIENKRESVLQTQLDNYMKIIGTHKPPIMEGNQMHLNI